MNAMLSLATGLALGWVSVYTLGLPRELREGRRGEIDSDLWEQQWLASRRGDPAFGTAVVVLSRAVLGIFDDLMWRLQAGAPSRMKGQTSVNDTWPMRIGFVAVMLPLLFLVANGLGIMLGNGEFDNRQEQIIWGFSFLVCPLVSAIGLWLCRTRPKLGLGLVVGGALSTALLMFWMAFITVPLAMVVIAFAIKRSGLAIWPFRPGTAGTA